MYIKIKKMKLEGYRNGMNLMIYQLSNKMLGISLEEIR